MSSTSRRRRPVASRSASLALALCAGALALSALAVASTELPVSVAAERAARFAERTCEHDPHCIRHGVMNCHRQTSRVVLCRIYDERRTRIQGSYRCHRLVRMSLDPRTRRKPITGLGRWHC